MWMDYSKIVTIKFNFDLKQRVFYKGDQYTILSRSYMQTSNGKEIIKYNLKAIDKDVYLPSILEDDIKGLGIIK